MKALSLLVLTAGIATAGIPEITTLTGKTYRQCEIVRVHPDGVSFTHATGAAKILFQDLSPAWRGRLGYDPLRAKQFQQEQKQKRELAEQARVKREAELSTALALAQQMELARLRGIEENARAQILAARNAPQNHVPAYPSLGAAHDAGFGWTSRPIWLAQPWPGSWMGGCHGVWPSHAGLGSFCRPRFQTAGCLTGRAGGVTFVIRR